MKANELMIGDWVLVDNTPIQVKQVYQYGIISDLGEGDEEIECFKPIPITPEILEKNGFTRYGKVYANLQQWVGKFGDKRKALTQDTRTGELATNDVWIKYVHELQHALKLCGIEKTIELFAKP